MGDIGIYLDEHIETEVKNFKEVQNFLREVMENFIEESRKFYDIYKFFPFTNGEKQVVSALFPAIHKITGNIFVEQPFCIGSYKRLLDIITVNNIKKQMFFIELKHGYLKIDKNISKKIKNNQSPNKNKFDGYLYDKWLGNKKEETQGAIGQSQDITKDNMEEEFYFELDNFDCKKIALIIIPSFIENNDSDIIAEVTAKEYSEYIFKKFEKIIGKNDNAKPNCIITYKCKESNNYKHEFKEPNNNTRIEAYPFLTFVARVENMN